MMMFGMTGFWIAALVVFMIVEWAVPGLVSIWFAIGSLAAVISSFLGAPIWLQVLWFFVVSIAALAATRPLAKKYINNRTLPTNADRAIGQLCIVKEEINNLSATGCVSLQGKDWSARSLDGAVIPAGTTVEVVRIEGVKLIVK